MDQQVPTLKLLKSTTYDCHVRVENCLDLLSSHLTQERYIAILAAFYGFYAPLEAQWHQYIEQPMYESLFRDRLKTPLLYNDLVALQLKTDTLVSLPLCAYTPRHETRMDVLGSITPAAVKPSIFCYLQSKMYSMWSLPYSVSESKLLWKLL